MLNNASLRLQSQYAHRPHGGRGDGGRMWALDEMRAVQLFIVCRARVKWNPRFTYANLRVQ